MSERLMARALALAARAGGRTSPNPLVGAVIEKNGRIIAEGYHKKAGGDHAEKAALKKAGSAAKGATVYVTLEPCCHTGRTGPCTNALIEAGVAKVVVAMKDPNPLVAGKGLAQLRRAGITVETGLLNEQARELNAPFIKYITQKIPYVIMKAASSADGRIAAATGDSRWITNEQCRAHGHRLRAGSDAVIVGIKTVLTDNPRLNAREVPTTFTQPMRVVLDAKLRTPPRARMLRTNGGPVIIACATNAPKVNQQRLETAGAEVIRLPSRNGLVDMKKLLKELAKREAVTVMLEGGAGVYTEALSRKLVDKAYLFTAPVLLGGDADHTLINRPLAKRVKSAPRLTKVKYKMYKDNVLMEGEVRY